jgi:hypothetical protein
VVELDAIDSFANRCVGGTLQYQFWVDGNGDNLGGNALDTLLRGWTDNPVIIQAPLGTSTYVVDVRCSADISCDSTISIEVPVSCPWSGARSREVWGDILAYPGYCSLDPEEFCSSDVDCAGVCVIPQYPNKDSIFLSWEGDKGAKKKGGTVRLDDGFKANGYFVNRYYPPREMHGFRDDEPLLPGRWYWYLLSPSGDFCNERGSWQNAFYCSGDGTTACVVDEDCASVGGTCSEETEAGRDEELP